MSYFFSQQNSTKDGVSAVIGVLILVVLVLLLTTGVYFTASNLTTNQPQDISAGTTTEKISPYEYQTTLITNGNADNIQVTSPLGTTYNLSEVGDYTNILAVKSNSNSQVSQLQIKGVNSNGQQQLLKSQTVDNGINPDLIVDKHRTGDYTSIQTAINNAPPATASNPAVIVVEKATYTENIDVSQNITLIAEHGTVIQDTAPNEPVVHIQGDDSQLRNFEVNGDPKANDDHYASHGVLVDGANAQLVGNSISNAQSPDLNSAGIAINSENSFVQYNNFNSNERSINLQSNAESPLVCGNQLSNSIGGFVSDQTKRDLAMNNYWQNGIPTNLVPDRVSSQVSASDLTQRQSLSAASSRVPVSMLPENSRAAQPFPGTQLSSNSQGASIQGCDVNVNFVNLGLTFSLSDIRVLVNGETPLAVYSSADQSSSSGQELANEQGERVAVCSCGGDGSYDDGDVITVYKPSSSSSSGSSTGETSDSSSGSATFPENPATDTEYTIVEASSSGGSTSYTPVDENSVEQVASVSPPQDSSTEETDDSQSSDLNVELGDKITAQVGDELVLAPVLNGSADNASYQWNFDDGTTASTKQVEHIYTNTGTYTVSLTVSQPNTSETATDSVTIEITESTSSGSFDTVSSTSELQAIVTDSSSTGSDTVYLSNGTYSITDISNPSLKVVGTGDGVVFENRVLVSSAGVTLRNVELQDGVSVSAGEFKLYNADVSSDTGLAVEVSTEDSSIYLGSSTVSSPNGVYISGSSDILVKNNEIESESSSGSAIQLGSRMSQVEIVENRLTAGSNGVYVGHATLIEHSGNKFNAPTEIYTVPNKAPAINDVSADVTLAGLPVNFALDASDPQGDRLQSAEWSLSGENRTKADVTDKVTYTAENSGRNTVFVTVTDELGKSSSFGKEYMFEEPSITLTSPSKISVGSLASVSIDTNIPSSRISYVNYDWGDGETDKTESYTQSHKYAEAKSQTINVTIFTESGLTVSKSKQISVVDSPVAFYSIETTDEEIVVGEPVAFNASASTAPNNNGLTYKWDFDNDGNIEQQGQSVNYVFDSFGSYNPKLIVETNGLTDSQVRTISVDDVSMDVSFTNTGLNVPTQVDVTTSADSLIEEYKVDWNGDGTFDETVDSSTFTHTYTSKNTYAVTIQAVTSDGEYTTEYTENITIKESPRFDISFSNSQPTTADSITMETINLENAQQPTIKWELGDGTVRTGSQVTHSYGTAKKYTVSVVVENAEGISKEKTKQITVGTAKQVLYKHNWGDDGWGAWSSSYDVTIENGLLNIWSDSTNTGGPIASNKGDFYIKVRAINDLDAGPEMTVQVSDSVPSAQDYQVYTTVYDNTVDYIIDSPNKRVDNSFTIPVQSSHTLIIQYDDSEKEMTYKIAGVQKTVQSPDLSNWDSKSARLRGLDGGSKFEYFEYGYGYQLEE